MSRPETRSLRDALARQERAAEGPGGGRWLHGRDRSIAFADLLDMTCLGGDVAGRRLMLVTGDQFTAALALIALDGLAEAVVLCPPDLAPENLCVVAARARADAVLSDRPRGALPGLDGLPLIDCFWPPVPAAREPEFERATEWLLLTSGTTGVPKLVAHDFSGLTGAIRPAVPGEAPPVWATFYDIRRYGGLQIFLRGVLGTGSLVLSSAGEAVSDHLRRLGRRGVTRISGTPSHWRRVLMSPERAAMDPAYIRLSGEIADQAVLDGLKEAYPRASIGHAYASTEAGVGFEVTDGLEGFPAALVGRTGAEVEMRVVDGSLRIRSRRTASAYIGQEGLALADDDGFIDTGDMVEERAGRYHFVGRRGGIINVGGLKVHPEEVEAVINRHARVRMSLVEARRNPITGSVVAASVVLNEGDAGPAEEIRREILATCRAELSAHKVPALLKIVPALDVTAAGKLARRPA
ncbi:fatty acid--CoA ligase family protein [Methylobacterium nigriterrae]|uniref:fatty acid--CoA ligase family protein n=1 Tax=Methylobacterium nigriterrae TaxID=3127512 RepID=UPI003013AC0D